MKLPENKPVTLCAALFALLYIPAVMWITGGGVDWLMLWAVSPLFAFGLAAMYSRAGWAAMFLGLELVLGTVALLGYYDSFHTHLDPQSALVLVFIPLYQYIALVLTLIAMGVAGLFRKFFHR